MLPFKNILIDKVISVPEFFSIPINSMPNSGLRLRHKTFRRYGTKCVKCHAEAVEAIHVIRPKKLKDRGQWILKTLNAKGKEDYLTVDHIIPLSKGGRKHSIFNVQPMCNKCNSKKGNI